MLPARPFIAASTEMAELTPRALLMGVILGVIFGASSLYLVLKVGLTVSASIPVAVISLAMFRGLSKTGLRDSTILEHNITQTAGSAGESIAFGLGVTMPAILILGFVILGGALILEFRVGPPVWVHVVMWGLITPLFAFFLLRVLKATLIALQFKHKAHEARLTLT